MSDDLGRYVIFNPSLSSLNIHKLIDVCTSLCIFWLIEITQVFISRTFHKKRAEVVSPQPLLLVKVRVGETRFGC